MSDPFVDLCLGVQAVRRSVEREIAGLGGATGVAASPYPHRLANVQRILADSRIRHLIADEVGLGKTVQALMVLNSLRLQNPTHRALILVPENLGPQWYLECQSRGHLLTSDRPPSDEADGQHVRLVYYEQLESPTEIDPALYDLLIVDEIQRLQSNIRQRIADTAGEFRQLLVLSATPKLEDLEAFRQLLAILEPERMAVAARSSEQPEVILRSRETAAASLLQSDADNEWAKAGLGSPPKRSRTHAVASAWCVLRRVTHARRHDYPDLLPQRELHRVAIEPTADEVARQKNVWDYINHAQRTEGSTDLARLGQVALRSPRALSERINILGRRDQRDPKGFLQAATKHLELSNGDSRLEALIDLIARIWKENPEEAILLVAEDNPTVDYLERMIPQILPEIGPKGDRRTLSLAIKRNRDVSATSDLVTLFGEYDESLGGFIDGKDQMLIAADVAQIGLNLQHATKLIFFSMPWSPAAVEQWIGRLDRLGSAALTEQSCARTIDIYAIYQRGQVDERVVSVLSDFGMFIRSIRLDGEEIKEVTQHIFEAALAPHTVSWQSLAREARAFRRDESDSLVTPLSSALPWQAEQARALANHFDQVGAIGPMLQSSLASRAIVRIETGLKGWMRLMARANAIRIWSKKDPNRARHKFQLLQYYRPAFAVGRIEPRFTLPGIDPAGGRRYAYLDARRALESPPIASIDIDDDPATPLHFLDHGNAVHETLISEWSKIGKAVPGSMRVRLPEGHALATEEGRGTYLIAVVSWVPGDIHLERLDRSPFITAMEEVRTKLEQKPYTDAIQQGEEDLRADRRWLNSLFASRLDILAARFADGAWTLADRTVADALCSPWCETARDEELFLATGHAVPLSPEVRAARNAGMQLLIAKHRERHEQSLKECPDIAARTASRRYLVDVESGDLVALRQAALDDAVAQGMETSEQGFTRSRFRAIRNARDMAQLLREIRLRRLDSVEVAIRDARFSEYKTLALTLE